MTTKTLLERIDDALGKAAASRDPLMFKLLSDLRPLVEHQALVAEAAQEFADSYAVRHMVDSRFTADDLEAIACVMRGEQK